MGTLENVFRLLVEPLALGAEVVGAATITVTVGYALLPYLMMIRPDAPTPEIADVRQRLVRGLVLGLEFLIGAFMLRLLIEQSLPTVAVLGVIILLRTVMALSLSYETKAAERRPMAPAMIIEPATIARENTGSRALWGGNGRAV
jgi:uncharacterized membrane protein